MRTAFIQQLVVEARRNPRLFLVVGDLGYSVVEPFAAEFPDRYLNAGVAEQNMTGVAAGLASEGYHVFTYSIANFPTLRCLEQIRNDIVYHALPVTVVSVGAGMSYGNLGYSHHAVQDIAAMRSLPSMRVLSPADPGETRECVEWLANAPCPSYLRLGKAGEPALHDCRGIQLGPLAVKPGDQDTALVATGSILRVALEASRKFAARGINIAVFSLPLLKPLAPNFLSPLRAYRRIIALEEHGPVGGLGDLLRSELHDVKIESISVAEDSCQSVGSQNYLRSLCGLTDAAVIDLLEKHSTPGGN